MSRVLWPATRVALNLIVIVAAIAIGLWLLWRLRIVVVPVLVALLLATYLVPPADFLRRHGWPSSLATLFVMAAGAATLGGAIALIAPAFVDHLGNLGENVEQALDEVVGWLVGGPFDLQRGDIDRAVEDATDSLAANAGGVGRGVLSGASVLAELLAGLLLLLVLLFFFTHDGRRMWAWAVTLAPERHRELVDGAGREVWRSTAGYMRGVALVAVVDAVLIGLALLVLGIPLVLPLMVIVFLGAFVPLVGAFIAGAVAVLVALVSEGLLAAALVVAAITAIQQVEGDLLYPKVVGSMIRLHPVAVLLALAAGTVVAGILGALLSVPVAAAVWTAFRYVRADVSPDSLPAPPQREAIPP